MIDPRASLSPWRWIVVNSSGGKDSQTALRAVVEACGRQGYPLSQVVVSHQDLGHIEWPGTRELVEKQAQHYGLRLEVSSYRNKDGDNLTLLDYAKIRQRWPDNSNRWCTSEFKRGPGQRVITKLCREAPGDVLQVFGFRAEESPARSKKVPFAINPRCTTKSRQVWDWLPIHDLTEEEVWEDIRESGVPYHRAYDLGMSRLSCRFCIFAPTDALLLSGIENPELLDEYCEVEAEIGHTFKNGQSLAQIRDLIRVGAKPKKMNGNWNM